MTMQEKYVYVDGSPTRVLQYGEVVIEEVALIIPGNPGMVEFYVEFTKSLHVMLGMPVLVISHAGHELSDGMSQPTLKGNGFLYGLSGQVKHKKDFICQHLSDNVKINLIGHSIGCKIIMELLKDEKVNYRFKKCILLFPTVERLAETPNGKFFVKMDRYFHSIIIWLIDLLKYLPYGVKVFLIKGYSKLMKMPTQFESAISDLINPMVLEKVFYMAEDEMLNVKDLDVEIVRKYIDNVYLYYGLDDPWCPKDYYEELKCRIPQAKAHLCQRGYKHAFVLKNPIEMAHIVADWIGTS